MCVCEGGKCKITPLTNFYGVKYVKQVKCKIILALISTWPDVRGCAVGKNPRGLQLFHLPC